MINDRVVQEDPCKHSIMESRLIKKIQLMFTYIVVKWYINNLRSKTSHIKRPIFSKETQKKEDNL